MRSDIELLGYAPQFVSHDMRLNSSEIVKVDVYYLPLNTQSPSATMTFDYRTISEE